MDNILIFDVDKFRVMFPAFSDPVKYPDETLQMYWDFATCYISDINCGWLNGNCRYNAISLMTANIAAQYDLIAAGTTAGIVTSATIDKITVGMAPPPLPNQWQYWLSQTPYGQQLLALLQAKSVGGFTIGGLPETAAFRRVAGIFV